MNVYLPDDLANEAREARLNVSSVLRDALRRELAARQTSAWLEQVATLPATGVGHDEALAALDAVRAEADDVWPPARDPA